MTYVRVGVATNKPTNWQVSNANGAASKAPFKLIMIVALLLMVAGCASEYTVHPSRRGWAKPGVSYVDARKAWDECIAKVGDATDIDAYVNKCMTEQGFVFKKVLGNDELPPCWYVSDPPCKDEPRPVGR